MARLGLGLNSGGDIMELELVQEIFARIASVSPPTIFLLSPGNLVDVASQWNISLALGLKLTLEAGEGPDVSRSESLLAINVVTLQPAVSACLQTDLF